MTAMREMILAVAVLLASACGGGLAPTPAAPASFTPPSPAGGSAPLVFRISPIDQSAIRWITPLGNLNPPDHALPTDHIYFYFADPNAGESPVARRTAFFAPADGTVEDLFNGLASDQKVFIRANNTVRYYVDHLLPDVRLTRGAKITAGQRLGTSGSAYAIDLGVVNDALTLAFVNPSRYAMGDTLHADAPLKYYEEPLRSQLSARVQRLGADRDGKIDYDLAGRLVGNWFIDGGSLSLTFAYDTYDPAQVRICTPGGFLQSGVFAIAPGEPLPRDISVASGKVRFTLSRTITGPAPPTTASARLLVQMLSDTRIQVEMFSMTASADDFTAASRSFIR